MIYITNAVDVLFGYVPDVVHTERVVFAAEIQLQIVVAVIVVDRHAHLEHLWWVGGGQTINQRSRLTVLVVGHRQVLPVPRIPSCSVR